MLTNKRILISTFVAGAAIAAYRLLTFGSADGLAAQAAAATAAPLGVSTEIGSASGEAVDVTLAGVSPVEYGGTVTRGAPLTADANGKAIVAATGNKVWGIALVAGVDGDIGSINIGATEKV